MKGGEECRWLRGREEVVGELVVELWWRRFDLVVRC